MATSPTIAADSSFVVPKGVVTVQGVLAPSGVLTFKRIVSDTTFSFQITDQTLRDTSSRAGIVVSAARTDGKSASASIISAGMSSIFKSTNRKRQPCEYTSEKLSPRMHLNVYPNLQPQLHPE